MHTLILGLTLISLLLWVGLLWGWGQFWQADQRLEAPASHLESWPSVCAVIPARNEAEMLPQTLGSLLTQDYPGSFKVVLVDDQSTDDTSEIAQAIAAGLDQSARLRVVNGQPLMEGWTGKLWALQQGIQSEQADPPAYWLFTDADIVHHDTNLAELTTKAVQDQLDLVSLMVLLRCESVWERLLIPAFVFFFQKLYPFPWVNDPNHTIAAAAGGCILIRSEALTRIGGMPPLRNALIDDCALAQAVKSSGSRGIWLGLTQRTRSLRPYPALSSLWQMVARTAYTQLNYSPWLLLGTLVGMTLLYWIAPISLVMGIMMQSLALSLVAGLTWLLMGVAYQPTLRLYNCSPVFGLALPGIGLLYTLMTLDSALQHWRGQGGQWKGRSYSHPST